MAGNPIHNKAVSSSSTHSPWHLGLVTMLFFIWGFLTVMNDILIPYLQSAFSLTNFQSMLVQSAFFAAYFVGSLIYFFISASSGDPIARIGYKNGIVLGLLVSAFGAFLFLPAGNLESYPFFLLALFILALGFTLLQISANPYVAVLGSEATASSRLNLSQGFNSLGTTLAPITGGFLIFNYFGDSGGATSTTIPYMIFAAVLLGLALVFYLIRLPDINQQEQPDSSGKALRFPQLKWGMGAIFFYVGAEVAIGSILIRFLELEKIAGLGEEEGSIFVSIYWGGLMIGRFLGAISLSGKLSKGQKLVTMMVTSLLCMLVIFGAIYLREGTFDWVLFRPYLGLAAVNILAFWLGRSLAARTLVIFSVICMALIAVSMTTEGLWAMWAVIGVGLFNSIMWSNIFTMSIEGLGKYKSQGSSLLVMMIIGGAALPPLQGKMADLTGSIQMSLIIPLLGYCYLIWYGWAWPRMMAKNKDLQKTIG